MNDIIINNSNIWIASRHCFKNSVGRKNKHFKKMWKIGGWRLYITHNLRLKNSQMRDQERNHNGICDVKRKLWNKHDGCCEMCGKKIDKFCHSQVHHVLNWWRFQQFETDERNLMLLCPECHKHIHTDPFLECRLIEATCRELGVNPKDYYDYGDTSKD